MSDLMFPKDVRYENEKMTRLAKGEPCQLRAAPDCDGGGPTSVWCHSNSSRHGRGKDHKSHDNFGAVGCGPCHYWLDFGTTATRAEKEDAMQRGMDRTALHFWRTGKFRVA